MSSVQRQSMLQERIYANILFCLSYFFQQSTYTYSLFFCLLDQIFSYILWITLCTRILDKLEMFFVALSWICQVVFHFKLTSDKFATFKNVWNFEKNFSLIGMLLILSYFYFISQAYARDRSNHNLCQSELWSF